MATGSVLSQGFHEVQNGNVNTNHLYALLMEETSISNSVFMVLYNPMDNLGIQDFGVVLSNGTNLCMGSARLTLSNGTISVSNAYRYNTADSTATQQAWNVSIRLIREI